VARFLARVARIAERHEHTVRRYGILGLVAFVFTPFWMTGPMVGCAIGYLLGLSAVRNLTVVLGATWAAIFCWAVLLRGVQGHLAAYGAAAPLAFVGVLVLIALAARLLNRKKD